MADRQRRVVWTENALAALDAVLEYIAQDSPSAARSVGEKAIAAADSLESFAERGRVVPEVDDPALREIFVLRYRMMYEVTRDEVRIVAFVHGARDFDQLRRRGQ